MTYNLLVQQEALEDLQEAFDYYESQQTNLGTVFIQAFQDLALRIEANPFLFQPIYNQKRRAIISRFQYNVIYEIEGSNVRVSAIIHGSRNPKRWQNR